MTNLIYNQMKPNEQKICFQGMAHVFLDSSLSFRKFKWNFDFFWVWTKLLEFYGLNLLTKSTIGLVMSIKWTYLVLWVHS